MTRQLEAVFEKGLLRPMEPLRLEESQRVLLTITDIPSATPVHARKAEQEWLEAHPDQYCGEWLALDGLTFVSHGRDARAVRDEARRQGVARPLLVQIPERANKPSAGLLLL
jgi:predicted DNA-binding antitoxin AbrB/MazE fold protein